MHMTSDIIETLHRLPRTLRVGSVPGGLCEYIDIQDAVDYATLAGGDWTVYIYPGTYTGVVVLTAGVNLKGIDKELCIIDVDHDTLITMAEGCCVSNLTLDVTSDVTASGFGIEGNDASFTIEDVNIILHRSAGARAVGISENTGNTAKTIYIRNVRCRMSDDSNEYGIWINQANKTVYIENSWIQGSDYGLAIGSSGGAAVASTVYATSSHFEATSAVSRGIFCNGGTIRLTGDSLTGFDHSGGAVNRENDGIVTCKIGPREYEVWAGMSIQDAIDAASAETTTPAITAPYTILIHPGIYDETIAMSTWVNLKGIGPKGSVVIYQNDANILTLADDVELQNFTLRLGTISATRNHITDGGAIFTARMTDIVLEVTTPGAFTVGPLLIYGGGSYIIERCSHSIGGTGGSNTLAPGDSTVRVINCDFEYTNVNAQHIQVEAGQTATVISQGTRWAGTCKMFVTTGDPHSLTFDGDALLATGDWSVTEATIILRNCVIEAPVVAGNLATVRMKNCSYRAISRAGTGNIVDESPYRSDAPWHVVKWNWMTALASMDVGVRGTPIDAGSGQVLLEVTDNVADFEAVEANTEAAGSLQNAFTPARTPRWMAQIAVDSFDAHVTMFFGLRETLGNAIPGATEHHAGFIWDGTNFKASSDDGVATQTTNLTTPPGNVHVSLEVIIFGGVTTVGWVEFYMFGILVATHSTRIPVNTLDWQHMLLTAGAGGGDDIDVVIRTGGCQECPA